MAKSFHFPLQKVLEFKKTIEDTQAIALKKSQLSLDKESGHLNNLTQKKDALLNVKEDDCINSENLSLNKLQISSDYVSQLNDKISSQVQVVEKSNEIVDKERDDLIEASKNKKIVEKLREHQLTDYKINNRKKETTEESEVALRVVSKKKNYSVIQ